MWGRHGNVEVKCTSQGAEPWCMVVLPCVLGTAEAQIEVGLLLYSDCYTTYPIAYAFKLPWYVVRLWSCHGVGPELPWEALGHW